jgi:predicted DNA-binding transcriptional regulator AlpA
VNNNSCPYPTKQSNSPLSPTIFGDTCENRLPEQPEHRSVAHESKASGALPQQDILTILRELLGSNSGSTAACKNAFSGSSECKARHGPPRFAKLESVAEQTAMGKSTVLAWEATGKFPRAVRLSATLRLWLQDDVDNWIIEQHKKSVSAPAGTAAATTSAISSKPPPKKRNPRATGG